MLVLFILEDIFLLIILSFSSIILYKELKQLRIMKRNIEKYENSNKK